MRRLPERHRQDFRKPFGTLYPGIDHILPLLASRIVYSVGDVVTYNLLQRGITPHVAIIDGHTMRAPCEKTLPIQARRLHAVNPAGTISDDLIEKIQDAVGCPPSLVFVEGEEDLAVIPLVLAAPMGAVILYGQPGEGVVMRIVDAEAKETADSLLALFIRE